MKIRIALDGTFMSLAAAKAKTTAEHRSRISTLKKDSAIATKIDKLRSSVGILNTKIKDARRAKKATTLASLTTKRDAARVKIKELKATLSTPAHVNQQKVALQIKKAQTAFDAHKNPENTVRGYLKVKTLKAPAGKPKSKAGKGSSVKVRRTPVAAETKRADKRANTQMDKLEAAYEVAKKAKNQDAMDDIREYMSRTRKGEEFTKAQLALVIPKDSSAKARRTSYKPGSPEAKARIRQLTQEVKAAVGIKAKKPLQNELVKLRAAERKHRGPTFAKQRTADLKASLKRKDGLQRAKSGHNL